MKPIVTNERRHGIEPLRMPRDEDESKAGMGRKNLAVGAEEDWLFAGASGSADPDRARPFDGLDGITAGRLKAGPGEQAERVGQLVLAVDAVGDLGGVELHRAGDADAVARRAQGDEPLGICLFLGADDRQATECWCEQRAERSVVFEAGRGEPPIHEQDRNASAVAVQDEVRPDLQFHQHRDARSPRIEHPAHCAAEVQGISDERHPGIGAVQLDAAGVAGVGGHADDEAKIGACLGEQADHGPGRVDLTQRHRMDHHSRGFWKAAASRVVLLSMRPVRSRSALNTFRRALGTRSQYGAAAASPAPYAMS